MKDDDDDHPNNPADRTDEDCDDVDRDTGFTEDADHIQDKEDDNTDDRIIHKVNCLLQEIEDDYCDHDCDDDTKERAEHTGISSFHLFKLVCFSPLCNDSLHTDHLSICPAPLLIGEVKEMSQWKCSVMS